MVVDLVDCFSITDIYDEHVELQTWCNGCVAWTNHFIGIWGSCDVDIYIYMYIFLLRVTWTYPLLIFSILQAASNGKYVDPCLEMLVGNFTPPHFFTDMLKQPRGISRKDQVLSRVHSSLKVVADLVPLSPMRLLPIVIQRKPHYCSKETVSWFGALQSEAKLLFPLLFNHHLMLMFWMICFYCLFVLLLSLY